MTIAWEAFTPWASLAGGILIGLAAAVLVLCNGRIAGISGIVGSLLGRLARDERGWRLAFLAGMGSAVAAWRLAAPLPEARLDGSPWMLAAAGLLVGLGTRYASGCTSGHGVCGLARGSVRSLAATGLFMAAAFATVFIVRHLGA